MIRSIPCLFIAGILSLSMASCQKPAPPKTVFDMPIPPKTQFFKDARGGRIKMYKSKLTQGEALDFYRKQFTKKEASFFKKRDTDMVMVAGNDMKVIEIITKNKITYISYSRFD